MEKEEMAKIKAKAKFWKVGEKVMLKSCPYDEQIPEELERFMELKDVVQTVTKITEVEHGQWIKTDKESDWIDSAWFKEGMT